jgi:hypothetical protein
MSVARTSATDQTQSFVPGPWITEVLDERSKRDLAITSPVAIWIAQENPAGHVVAVVEDVSPERAAANARLIAAAPTLLAALQLTAGNIRSLGPSGALSSLPESYRIWLSVVDEAIAAAEGAR